MNSKRCVASNIVVIVLLALCCGPAPVAPPAAVVGPPDLPASPTVDSNEREKVFVSADLFAAFLVAFDAQKELWREKGVELTPRELSLRHGKIGCQRDESGMVDVTFYPEQVTLGGSVRYIVDPKNLKIVKRSFGR